MQATAFEEVVRRSAPGAQVKLTLLDGIWRVRALLPAAMCARGGTFADRDASRQVAEALEAEGLPTDVFPRRGLGNHSRGSERS